MPLLLHLCSDTVEITRVWILFFQIGHSGDGIVTPNYYHCLQYLSDIISNFLFLFRKKITIFRVEINIKPWETLSKELKKANEKLKWSKREPYAYWKGNPYVGRTRMDMLKCNVSEKQDRNARIYKQVMTHLRCSSSGNTNTETKLNICRTGLKNRSKGSSNQI